MVVAVVVDEVADVLTSAQHVDASALCLGELLSLTRHLTRELTERLARPDFVESLNPVVDPAEASPEAQEHLAGGAGAGGGSGAGGGGCGDGGGWSYGPGV